MHNGTLTGGGGQQTGAGVQQASWCATALGVLAKLPRATTKANAAAIRTFENMFLPFFVVTGI